MLSPFEEVLSDVRSGKMVIMVDDEDRENEGDLIIPTECITSEAVAFMIEYARGLICVSIDETCAQLLNLPLQTLNNNSPFHTPFAVSIDHRDSASTGVTASGRANTMRRLIDSNSRADDFLCPGSVFPLIAHRLGVIGRPGQTEGSLDLARIAGFQPSGVLCEILNSDGTMARGESLIAFARRFDLKITSVADVTKYRVHHEVLVRETVRSVLDTDEGKFATAVFTEDVSGKEHLVLMYGLSTHADGQAGVPPLVRIHSECLTGDVFGSRRCDCGPQLQHAMRDIVKEGAGVVLYLRQEGRGIGLSNKVKAYALQDEGHDTVEANVKLGFGADLRDFAVAAKILSAIGLRTVRLMTNNPEKLRSLRAYGIKVEERVPLVVPPDQYSKAYLETKRTKLGHLL